MAIRIGGYKKTIIRPGTPEAGEMSEIYFNPGARTPRHDHSVDETTEVLEGGPIYQIIDGVKAYYNAGDSFFIPAGIIHEVGLDHDAKPAHTRNTCAGVLVMNFYPSSEIE
jgi:quercetin dioxygenase-like cupin family protein